MWLGNVSSLPDHEEEGNVLVNSSHSLLYKLRAHLRTSYQRSHSQPVLPCQFCIRKDPTSPVQGHCKIWLPGRFNSGPPYPPPFCSFLCLACVSMALGYSLPYTGSRLGVCRMWAHGPDPACWLCLYGPWTKNGFYVLNETKRQKTKNRGIVFHQVLQIIWNLNFSVHK